ncbi:MAG: alpha/beta fold hydrolase [Actinobacteria bacterium]|nr:alpha/beta fold hydrolase [Actinomycetota bacterium]
MHLLHHGRLATPSRAIAAVLAAGLLAAACASEESSGSATTATPATATPATATPATATPATATPATETPATTTAATTTPTDPTPTLTYATPGSHAVGYRAFTTSRANEQALTVRAWYPAAPPTDDPGPIEYSAPNKFGVEITPGELITSVGRAIADAPPEPADEPYPLVVFSHGFALSPIVYSMLVEHYASHGYIVLAPEHDESFDGSLTGFWEELIDRPVDVRRTIDLAEQLTESGGPLAGLIDMDDVAVVGHSYGGYTALAAAGARFDFAAYADRCGGLAADDPLNFFCAPLANESDMAARAGLDEVPSGLWPSLGDPRVTAAISLAGDAYPFDQRGLAELEVPVMAMGGTVDDGTPYEWGAKLTYDHAGSENKTLITFPGAGHMLFLDPCENLPWVENSVYRDALCTDAVWETRPFDIVAHYTTAFLRDTLDADPDARAALAGEQPRLDDVEYDTTLEPSS